MTIAPSNVFTLFTNSTEQQYADAHLSADQVCSIQGVQAQFATTSSPVADV